MDDKEQERNKELEEQERQQRLENMQRRSDGQMGVGFDVLYEPNQDEGEKKDGE